MRLRQITEGIVLPEGARRAGRGAVYRIAPGGFDLARITRLEARYDDFSRLLRPAP